MNSLFDISEILNNTQVIIRKPPLLPFPLLFTAKRIL